MNITVNSQVLATELRLLVKVVPSNPAIAILGSVLLRASDRLYLYATDLEVGLGASCEARVDVAGVLALPASKLLALVEQFPDADVNITLDKLQVTVRCGKFKSRLQAQPVDDFPAQPAVEGVCGTLDGAAFRQLIGRTRYAVSASATRYILQGALLTLAQPAGAMAATDGKRLALATIGYSGEGMRVVIPAKALDILVGHGSEGNIELTTGSRHLFFAINDRLLTSRTLDGEFPKYEGIIPRDNDRIVTVERNAFMAALRRIILVAEENKAVYFNIESGVMELSSASAEVGSADETVQVAYDGPPLRTCMNGSYVIDFLDAASGQVVTIAMKDASSPALFTAGPDHVAVVMLMRR